MATLKRTWLLVLVWALVLGVAGSLIADWGEWDRIGVNIVWRVLLAAIGGLLGIVLNYFAGFYVSMGTNVVESTGMFRFSGNVKQKIENAFIFVGALLVTLLSMLVIK
jgi:hypothetical protein